jgi:hypothetical protein
MWKNLRLKLFECLRQVFRATLLQEGSLVHRL